MPAKHHSFERLREKLKNAMIWIFISSTGDDYKNKGREMNLLQLSMHFEIYEMLLILKLLDGVYDVSAENVKKITETKTTRRRTN